MRPPADLLFSPYRLDVREERLLREEVQVPLRMKPFALLRYLAENPGRIVEHEELRKAIWPTTYVSAGVLRVYLREVRAALGDDAEAPRFIETVARRGYRFLPAITKVGPGPSTTISKGTRTLVGRSAELAKLREALDQCSGGVHKLIFVGGEHGVGKSALVEAFLETVSADPGVLIGRGQCIQHSGEVEPYLPLLDGLRGLCQIGGEPAIEVLRRYAPTWLVQMPGLIDDSMADIQTKIGGAGQGRMLREMSEALEWLSVDRVVVLVLEDLHWSDPSTLTVLGWLARRPEPSRVLLLATLRPEQGLPDEHPLRSFLHEQSGRYSDEIRLGPLGPQEIASYLEQRMGVSGQADSALQKLARAIHLRTDGHPLFMVALIAELLDGGAGAIRREGESSKSLHELAERSERALPRDLTEMISRQFGCLDPAKRRLLEVAAVAGLEFSASAIAATGDFSVVAVEEGCASLARRKCFLEEAGDVEWPDGTVAMRFRFAHALYRDVVYVQLTSTRRSELHARIGERMEQAYGARCDEIASELAFHFEQGHDWRRTLRYHEQAARRALTRNAPREAIDHLTAAGAILERLPGSHERIDHELQIQLAMGAALQSTRGYGALEVKLAYERADTLCRLMGETSQVFPAQMGLWSFAIGRGEWGRGQTLAERNLRLAQTLQQPALLARAWRALGHGQFFLGRYDESRQSLERAIALTGDSNYPQDTFTYTSNTAVDARSALSWTLEVQGYPGQAMATSRESLAVAEKLDNKHDLIYAHYFATVLHGFRLEWSIAESLAHRTIELATDHGLPYFQALGLEMQGTALAQQGNFEQGLVQMREAIAIINAIGVEAGLTGMYLMIADTCLRAGKVRDSLAAISSGFNFVTAKDEHAWEPELLRVKGELLDARGRHSAEGSRRNEKEAEELLLAAHKLARDQGSGKWELRAAMSLSKLFKRQRRKKEAREILAQAYGRFTEGFDTQELQNARALLEQLSRLRTDPRRGRGW